MWGGPLAGRRERGRGLPWCASPTRAEATTGERRAPLQTTKVECAAVNARRLVGDGSASRIGSAVASRRPLATQRRARGKLLMPFNLPAIVRMARSCAGRGHADVQTSREVPASRALLGGWPSCVCAAATTARECGAVDKEDGRNARERAGEAHTSAAVALALVDQRD